jgi:hypothetical protein
MTSSLWVNHYFPEVRICKEISNNVKSELFLNFMRLACSNNQKNRYLMSRIGNTKQTRSDRIPISSCRHSAFVFLSAFLPKYSCPTVSLYRPVLLSPFVLFSASPHLSYCPPASIYLPVHLSPSIFLSACLPKSSCLSVLVYPTVRLFYIQ